MIVLICLAGFFLGNGCSGYLSTDGYQETLDKMKEGYK